MEDKIFEVLGKELIQSPFLSIMVLNDKYEIVWHNDRFGEEFSKGKDIINQHCFEVVGSTSIHPNCPIMKSMKEGKRVKGFVDFGEFNFLYFTIPIASNLAAKIHIFLPKEPDNLTVEK